MGELYMMMAIAEPQGYLKFLKRTFFFFRDWLSIKKGYREIRKGYWGIRVPFFYDGL